MEANRKQEILDIFIQWDEDGSSIINKDVLIKCFRSKMTSDNDLEAVLGLLNTFVVPSSGGIDYKRLLDWVWAEEGKKEEKKEDMSQNQLVATPLLAPAIEKLLSVEPPVRGTRSDSKQRHTVGSSLLERRRKTAPKMKLDTSTVAAEKVIIEAPAFDFSFKPKAPEQTITGRILAEAPHSTDVIGTQNEDYKGMVTKEEDASTGALLQKMADSLSDDIFGLPFSVSVAIPHMQDTPLIAISDGFTKLTGYSREEIVGRNCRFLLEGVPPDMVQSQTRVEARRYCRAAHLRGLTTMSHSFLIQRNARKNGELFWNLFMLSFVPAPGAVKEKASYIIGLQLDLGPDLNLAQGADVAAAIEPHRKHLHVVQQVMFGQTPSAELSGDHRSTQITQTFENLGERLADDMREWIREAESSSEAFQTWGTLPFAVWPETSKYAVLNGGCTLLRLEADEVQSGGIAMSIFPVKKSTRGCGFKLQVDAVCTMEPDITKGGRLPSLGFTDLSPWSMHNLGGLPSKAEQTAKSTWLRGDGNVFARTEGTHGEDAATSAKQIASGEAASEYLVKPGDVLECLWGNGLFEVSVDGETIYRIKNKAIPKPPKKPMYALVDCCFAACKTTLMV